MPTTFLNLQQEILHTLDGFGMRQGKSTFLTAPVTDSGLELHVESAEDASQGVAEVGGELIYIRSADRSTDKLAISADGRGYYGSTAASHETGDRVTLDPTWTRLSIQRAINDTIRSVFPTIFGVDQTQFTFTPSVSTYSLPADAERVLKVTADLNGPSMEQQIIRRYSFNSVAPTDDWATTNTLTLQQGVTPGRTVTVTYAKAPSALSADEDVLTSTGLAESAKELIVLGALAKVVGKMDLARLPVDSATSQHSEDNPIGIAARLGANLYSNFQLELENERKRLRLAYPPTLNRTTR